MAANLVPNTVQIPIILIDKYLDLCNDAELRTVLLAVRWGEIDTLHPPGGWTTAEIERGSARLVQAGLLVRRGDRLRLQENERDIHRNVLENKPARQAKLLTVPVVTEQPSDGYKVPEFDANSEGFRTFLATIPMTDSVRQAAYLFFVAAQFDITRPRSFVADIKDFRATSATLAELVDGDWNLIQDAVNHLRANGMTITSPRSLHKTVLMLKANKRAGIETKPRQAGEKREPGELPDVDVYRLDPYGLTPVYGANNGASNGAGGAK